MTDSEFGFVLLSWVGWIHSWTEIMLLPLSIVAQWSLQNCDFWLFRDRFKSWSAPNSKMEVMTDSKFGFLFLSWVGWIHSCAKIMLLPMLIDAQ